MTLGDDGCGTVYPFLQSVSRPRDLNFESPHAGGTSKSISTNNICLSPINSILSHKTRNTFRNLNVSNQEFVQKAVTNTHSIEESIPGASFNKSQAKSCTKSFNDSLSPILPVLPNLDQYTITPETLSALISGKYSHYYDEILIIDARFQYEYNGGHIDNAINFNHVENLFSFIDQNERFKNLYHRICIVVHCEFSSQRAPEFIKSIRSKDRSLNPYPELIFPELYLLFGGYKNFFLSFPEKCNPKNYVTMNDPRHVEEMKNEIKKSRRMKAYTRSCPDLGSMAYLYTSEFSATKKFSNGIIKNELNKNTSNTQTEKDSKSKLESSPVHIDKLKSIPTRFTKCKSSPFLRIE
ncbi:M-phase inducer phosphatase 3-like [Schistocerca gregaria]|uniref:M-phase inducer phosphatase 3-like n=1 Tax=Schistocerca gregaria TaxID=7010 RepID=UPI00211EC5AD|nr:M-phase inducer phosphatase 3-like [Schistocerca gregaria]